MAILFCGSEQGEFISTAVYSPTTNAIYYDSAYQRCALKMEGNFLDYFQCPAFAAVQELWAHARCYTPSQSGTGSYGLIILSGSTVIVRQFSVTGDLVQYQYYNGSTWVNFGTAYDPETTVTIDMHVVLGASGSITVYHNGTEYATVSADLSHLSDMTAVGFGRVSSQFSVGNRGHWSEIIVADESTIGWRLQTKPPTANGTHVDFTGDYTLVDEVTLDDADFISGAADGDAETFTAAARVVDSFEVKGIAVLGRMKRDVTGPQNAQFMLRKGGVDYVSSNLSDLDTDFKPILEVWETDPSTGAKWTEAAAEDAALQFGVKAIT